MINLNEKYNQDDFLNFLKDFLPDFEKDIKPVGLAGLQVIKKSTYLGNSKQLDLGVFELSHTGSQNKRVTLATDGFRILKQSATFQALVIFCSPDTDEWRLSLMTATPERNERGGVIVRLSNPKRYSFALGERAKTNTPYNFLIRKGKLTDFEDLKSRFSVEVVNKEFYKEIANLYTKLVGGVRGEGRSRQEYPGIIKLPSVPKESRENQEFAVRLIGRIIFCWFLREKRSESGLSLIPNDTLSLNAAKENYDYYHSILEPLFFEILNKNRDSRKDKYQKDPYKQIPYLNGGLFSPQQDDYYSPDDEKQTVYHNTLVVPDEWLHEFLEVLERYNFTVDENTSVDIDLSIDPEMLGRIFENLLAEINPETGESARKSTGSYYTPRTIVEYMVDESLYQYLKGKTNIEEAKLRALISYDLLDDEELPMSSGEKEKVVESLSTITILDPACGSGAFPIGALQKIVFMLQKLDPNGQLWFQSQLEGATPEIRRVIEREFAHRNFDYIRKLGVIRESIFGIDIQPIATEIARLRCFLTLVVEERVADEEPNRGIEPLPNLDFKFVTANSLIGLPNQQNGQAELFEDQEGIDQLKEVRDAYFNASGPDRENLKTKFVQIQNKMFQKMIAHHYQADLTRKLSAWDPFGHEAADWFDTDWMFGIKNGFEIIIGNPPYGSSIKNELRKILVSSLGKVPDYEIYYFFLERGRNLLSKEGTLSYIVPNTFLFNVFADSYRKELLKVWSLLTIIDCTNFKLFESATVFNSIVIFKKDGQSISIGYKNTLHANSFTELIAKPTQFVKSETMLAYNQNWGLVFRLSEKTLELVSKIKSQSVELQVQFPDNSQGLIAYDKYQGQNEEIIRKRAYHFSQKVRDDLKPWLNGEDVKKYLVKWNEKEWIDYQKGIANPRKPKFFKESRILIREITNPAIYAAFTDQEFYNDPSVIIVLDNPNSNVSLLYTLGILNSSLATFYHFNGSPKSTKGAFPKILVKDIQEFPLKIVSREEQAKIVELVNKILAITQSKDYLENSEKQTRVKGYEKQIDQLVYKLYDLTPEEIKIVESSL